MLELNVLSEAFLIEAALTKGSQRVLNDTNVVSELADAIRDDVATNASAFPSGFKLQAKRSSDEQLAQWFLENLDKIEREGYEGTIYSRDGVYADWIVRRYIAGSHSWEDLTGVMNMHLRDWYILKNRNMLEPQHQSIPKFKSVRDVGLYMATHYRAELADIRAAAAAAAAKKMNKSAKLVDNDDYKIHTVFNWAASRSLGLGTNWCTANSTYRGNYESYSSRAMLFQLFPKDPEEVNITTDKRVFTGNEKYQFDAGGPHFMDLTDRPANKAMIRERFPYIYDDLVTALTQNKEKLTAAMEAMVADPQLKTDEARPRAYNIDDEIEKLSRLVTAGWFTTEKRPKVKSSADEPEQDVPQIAQQNPPQQGQNTMEKVDKDVAAMLESLKKYDILKESVAPVLERKKVKEEQFKDELDEDEVDEDEVDDFVSKGGKIQQLPYMNRPRNPGQSFGSKHIGSATGRGNRSQQRGSNANVAVGKEPSGKPVVSEGADADVLAWMGRFAKLGNMKGYGR